MLLTSKNGFLTNENEDYSLKSKQYSIRCFGGLVPTATPTSAEQVEVTYKTNANSVILDGFSGDLSSKYTFLTPPDSTTVVTLTNKIYNYIGAEATYIFKVKPGIFYPVGSRIIFEFPSPIAPKFNKAG